MYISVISIMISRLIVVQIFSTQEHVRTIKCTHTVLCGVHILYYYPHVQLDYYIHVYNMWSISTCTLQTTVEFASLASNSSTQTPYSLDQMNLWEGSMEQIESPTSYTYRAKF